MKCNCGNFPLIWPIGLAGALVLSSVGAAQICDIFSARVTLDYREPASGQNVKREVTGRFGVNSPLLSEVGKLVHVVTEDSMNHGCTPATNIPEKGPWVALIQRGGCKFAHKIAMTQGFFNNASAVIIYNHQDEDTLITMDGKIVDQVPSVFIHKVDGDALALLVDSGADVRVNITEGIVLTTLRIYEDGSVSVVPGPGAALDQRNVTPVKNLQLLVVCLSFVALLTVGLVCLLVYAVKRNKYLQAKNRARNPIYLVDVNGEGKEAHVELLGPYSNPRAAVHVAVSQLSPSLPLQEPDDCQQPVCSTGFV